MKELKTKFLNQILDLGYPESEIVLTLKDFFEGNDIQNSIGVNLFDRPSTQDFYNTFKKITEESKGEAFVRIADVEDPEEWFFSDAIHLVCDMTLEEVEAAMEPLQADIIEEAWSYGLPGNLDASYHDKKVFTIMWDSFQINNKLQLTK
ncbi:MAG: hypothetical protein H7282_14560 [Cytophagaceae bacterium]|nr:hypothetical protein [Cytophagaceae bacterium]